MMRSAQLTFFNALTFIEFGNPVYYGLEIHKQKEKDYGDLPSLEIKTNFKNWDKEGSSSQQHEDFLFIRETKLLTLDEQIENIDHLMITTDFGETFKPPLVHGNKFGS